MTLNCCKVKFSRNFAWFRVFSLTTKIWMQIDPYCQRWKCSLVNVLSSDIRVMQIFAGVWEIWGIKQESGRLGCRFSYLPLAVFSKSSSPRLKSAAHSICVKLLHKHDKLTQCCRAFTLALARLSCMTLLSISRVYIQNQWSIQPWLLIANSKHTVQLYTVKYLL